MTPAALALGAALVRASVAPDVTLAGVPRVGVNLGPWRAWGAEQLSTDVLQNPGFEGLVDRAVVIVKRVSGARFTDPERGLARPDGFWDGARLEVRTGAAAGTTGSLRSSRQAGLDGDPEFESAAELPGLAAGDVVALTAVSEIGPPVRWRVGVGRVTSRAGRRPGGAGRRVALLDGLRGVPAALCFDLDTLGRRAGRLLPVRAEWRAAVWARSDAPAARLRLTLSRAGHLLLDRSIAVSGDWQRLEAPLDGPDGDAGALELRLSSEQAVQLDDASLGPPAEAPALRAEALAALRLLRPGLLRDWQGGQGDPLQDRLVPATARRVGRASATATEAHFALGLREVLAAARELGATPWLVGPVPYGDQEWRELGRYLGSAGLPLALVEFGNENWNLLSRSAGLPDPVTHGAAADRAFRLLREGLGTSGAAVLPVVNAPFFDPPRALAFLAASREARLLAVAPYLFRKLPAGLPGERALDLLFASDAARFAALGGRGGRELAVYEVNLHATGGDAPAQERDPLVAGAVSGTALALRLLEAQAHGVRRACVWALAGFDTWTDDRRLVRLFGVMRDLAGPPRPRPTGLAVALLNRALPGDAHRVDLDPALPGLAVAAYLGPAGWTAALASSRPEPIAVEVRFPTRPAAAPPARLLALEAAQPLDTNEEAPQVRVRARRLVGAGPFLVELAPRGLAVLAPEEVHDPLEGV